MVIGLSLGTVAGYIGGVLDLVLSKYADLLLALPTTLVALVVAGLVDGGYWVTVLVLMLLFSPTDIRMVRGAVIAQSTRPYIESARVLHISRRRIMFRHIVPNVAPVVIISATVSMGGLVLAESGLSFLGFALWTVRGDALGEADDARAARAGRWALLTIGTAFFLAELGDKTMLATITLATTGEALPVWLGSTAGMVIADAVAIGVGALLGSRLPERAVKVFAAAAFVLFGVLLMVNGVVGLVGAGRLSL